MRTLHVKGKWIARIHKRIKSEFLPGYRGGDSMIVLGRLVPRKRKKPRIDNDARGQAMAALGDQCRTRLVQLGAWSIEWQGRENNVEAFGH